MKSSVGYDAAISLACTGQKYEEKYSNGYLTFSIDTPDSSIIKNIRVDSSEMEKDLSSNDVQEIIGFLIFLELPIKLFQKNI